MQRLSKVGEPPSTQGKRFPCSSHTGTQTQFFEKQRRDVSLRSICNLLGPSLTGARLVHTTGNLSAQKLMSGAFTHVSGALEPF